MRLNNHRLTISSSAPQHPMLVEDSVSHLLSALFCNELQCIIDCNPGKFQFTRPWIFFEKRPRREFALSLEKLLPLNTDASYFGLIAVLANALEQGRGTSSVLTSVGIIKSFSLGSPLCEYKLELFSADTSRKFLGEVYFAEFAIDPLESDLPYNRIRDDYVGKAHNVSVRVNLNAQVIVARGIRKDDQTLVGIISAVSIELDSRNYTLGKCGKLEFSNGKFDLSIFDEECMELNHQGNDLGVILNISLGSLEMTVQQLLSLRSGMSIQFEAGLTPVCVVLMLGDASMARCEVSFGEGNEVTLKVLELLSLPKKNIEIPEQQFAKFCDYLYMQCEKRL